MRENMELEKLVMKLQREVDELKRENNKRHVQFAPQGGGDPLPEPNAQYEVVSVVEFMAASGPNPKTWKWGADWVRAHA